MLFNPEDGLFVVRIRLWVVLTDRPNRYLIRSLDPQCARPLLRASAEALMASPALYPPRPGAAGATEAAKVMGLGGSASAALHVHHSVQRLVVSLQLRQLVRTGMVAKQSPVPTPADWEQRSMDLGEGQQVCVCVCGGVQTFWKDMP